MAALVGFLCVLVVGIPPGAAQPPTPGLVVIPDEGGVDHEHPVLLTVIQTQGLPIGAPEVTYTVDLDPPRTVDATRERPSANWHVSLGPFPPGTRIAVEARARIADDLASNNSTSGRMGGNTSIPAGGVTQSLAPLVVRVPQVTAPLWHQGSVATARLAQELGRPMVLLSCRPTQWGCQHLRTEVFAQPALLRWTGAVVLGTVDPDQEPTFARVHAIITQPTLLALEPGGNETDRVVGSPTAETSAAFVARAGGHGLPAPAVPTPDQTLPQEVLVFGASTVLALAALGQVSYLRRRERL